MLTQQKLIGVTTLTEWTQIMSDKYRSRVENLIPSREYISIVEETHIKSFFSKIIGKDELKLLRKLMTDCNGIKWETPVDGCPSKNLIDLGLARFDCGKGERLLKATRFAFYHQIQFLIGLVNKY